MTTRPAVPTNLRTESPIALSVAGLSLTTVPQVSSFARSWYFDAMIRAFLECNPMIVAAPADSFA